MRLAAQTVSSEEVDEIAKTIKLTRLGKEGANKAVPPPKFASPAKLAAAVSASPSPENISNGLMGKKAWMLGAFAVLLSIALLVALLQ
jgi:hypothetical protein